MTNFNTRAYFCSYTHTKVMRYAEWLLDKAYN